MLQFIGWPHISAGSFQNFVVGNRTNTAVTSEMAAATKNTNNPRLAFTCDLFHNLTEHREA